MGNKKLCIALPASVVSDTPHLREKTAKVGLIGRAAAIFRVDEIKIYPDNPKSNQARDMDLVATLLAYMETPQYLRKRLFKLEPELQYAGVLPPLRTLHHPLNREMKDLKTGEYREGVTLSRTKEGMLTDIGVEQPALVLDADLPVGKRITVKITEITRPVVAKSANRDAIPDYWGYVVTAEKRTLGKIVKSSSFDLVVATSKFGVSFADVAEKLSEKWHEAENVLVAFGSPTRGLYDVAKSEGLRLDDVVDFVVNTVPSQGTETVRTEEALVASLAIFNAYFDVTKRYGA
jgi:predicted SPOUT superfamily RNA methylase MTH1